MRFFFYSLAGIVSALTGWNISLLLIDIIKSIFKTFGDRDLPFNAEFIIFPIVASCLSIGLIITAIYLSNPIHYKANSRIRRSYLNMAFKTGFITGLIAAIVTVIISKLPLPPQSIRIVSWAIIGSGIGFAEALCWLFLSVEGANSSVKNRRIRSPLLGLAAGLIAAIIIELLQKIIKLGGYTDSLGFILLGTCLGISLVISTTPAYQVALRAGRGFGIINSKNSKNTQQQRPKIKSSSPLSLVYFPDQNEIEEGLSIQLPPTLTYPIFIGSSEESDIVLPNIPAKAAKLTLEKKQWKLICLADKKVQIQRRPLLENSRPTPLNHNQILTFYYENNDEKFYRFIFYDRFLDPSS